MDERYTCREFAAGSSRHAQWDEVGAFSGKRCEETLSHPYRGLSIRKAALHVRFQSESGSCPLQEFPRIQSENPGHCGKEVCLSRRGPRHAFLFFHFN